jgi:hypothetical protein
MQEFTTLFEAALSPEATKKVAVFVGRFQPPTQGHYTVIDFIKKFIRDHKNLGLEANPVIVIIDNDKSNQDKSRNPLSVADRETFMKASGKANGCVFFDAHNAFAAFADLRDKGYEPIAIAAGSDNVDNYIHILDQYFKTDDDKDIKHYKIQLGRTGNSIESNKEEKIKGLDYALTHLEDTGDIKVSNISASLARFAVKKDKLELFAKIVGLENKLPLAKTMFNKIAKTVKE